MKKYLLVLIAISMASAIWAQESFALKFGGGGIFTANLRGGVSYAFEEIENISMDNVGGGVFVFFDVMYAELFVAYDAGSSTIKVYDSYNSDDDTGSFSALDFGALLKFPFRAYQALIYPLAGVNYQVILSRYDKDGYSFGKRHSNALLYGAEASDLNSFWVKFGFGIDVEFALPLFIRVEALYGVRFTNKFESDLTTKFQNEGANTLPITGHGPTIKIGIGYTI
jgi:hypothetical protein